jgi:two-component system response regulator CpxR
MPIILISRGTMSGVSLLVKSLVDHMGYRNVAREDLVSKVNEHGEIAHRIVGAIGTATRAYEQFSQLRRPYIILMRLALLEYIRDDNVIYHGYSGHLLVPPMQHMLRVRINAPLSMRIPMTMERLGCGEQQAREHILGEDEQRGRWARFMYGRDIRDPGLYDIVLNINRLSTRSVCALLQCTVDNPDFKTRPETVAALERSLIAARIEATIATDPRTRDLDITAQVLDDRVALIGPWLEEAQRDTVLAMASVGAAGRRVDYDTGYLPVVGLPIEDR